MLQVGKAAQRSGSPPAVLAPQRTGSSAPGAVNSIKTFFTTQIGLLYQQGLHIDIG
ncbi:MAG: hypothetical protein HC862_12150 [Scytonema sp. RU_4_4]|nr:hypothetical protein [Scytonema sp. RU_4_4]